MAITEITATTTDDTFTKTGLTEDSLRIVTLDVMANDSGKKTVLWSLDNTAVDGSADLIAQDTTRTEALSTDTSNNGAKIWITSTGKVGYDANTLSAAFKTALQHLNTGESLTDTFTYAVKLSDGTLSWATATVQINGVNDAAVISGAATGSVIEAGGVANATTGTPTVTGTLIDSDVDNTVNTFQAVAAGAATTKHYGTYAMTAGGEWTYTLNNSDAAVQALNVGDTLTDTFTVRTADGTAQVVTVTINGTNDAAVITGTTTGSIMEAGGVANAGLGPWTDSDDNDNDNDNEDNDDNEDSNDGDSDENNTSNTFQTEDSEGESMEQHGNQKIMGKLFSNDVDNIPTFQAVPAGADTTNHYGTYAMTVGGVWTYTLDNTNTAVQALNVGDTLTDTFTVLTVDGTPQIVTVTINGSNDAPTLDLDANDSSAATGNGYAATYTNTGAAVAIADIDTSIIDVDDVNIESATVTLTNMKAGDSLEVNGSLPGGITAVINNSIPGVITLTLSGSASKATYEGALHQIVFSNSTNTDTTDRIITVKVNDGLADSSIATSTIHVLINQPAIITGISTAELTETNAAQSTGGTLVATDPDSSNLFVVQSAAPGSNAFGKFSITDAGVWSYTMDNAHNEFVAGTDYTDSITVATADGTTQLITVTMHGTDDVVVGPTDNDIAVNTVAENSVAGTVVGITALASDADAGATISYTLSSNPGNLFAIDSGTGVVTVAGALDYETATSHNITVLATSSDGSTASDIFSIAVSNVNEAPTFAATSSTLTIVSNTGTNAAVTFTEAALSAYFADVDSAAVGVNTFVTSSGLTSVGSANIGAANVGTVGTLTITDDGTLTGAVSVTATDGSLSSTPATTVTYTNQATSGPTLTAAGSGDSIIINSQITGKTLTGGTGKDYIIGNSGNDIIVGAQNDIVLNGGTGTDTLQVGANFTSSSNGQIVIIENVTLTTSGLTLNLSNQTEGFNITGSSGVDTITGGSGADTITGGSGADTMTGGAGVDTFTIGSAGSPGTTGGSGNAGTITGYDVITDFASDILDLPSTTIRANTSGTDGVNTALTISSQTVKSHAISNGIITFDDNDTFANALSLASLADVAAVVEYLHINDLASGTGAAMAFVANIGGTAHTYVFEQVANGQSLANDILIDLVGVTLTNISGAGIAPAGVAGEAINLGLTNPEDHVGAVTVNISGVPADWTLSEGADNGDGTWTVQTNDVTALTITTPVDYIGAVLLRMSQTWTDSSGGTGLAMITNNVEAYAPDNPIFALSSDDNLTGSSGNDLFVFAQPIGNNIIYSFDTLADKIDLIGFAGVAGFADLTIANDANGNAVITIGTSETIMVKGVDATALSAGNFRFDIDPVTINTGTISIADGAIMPFGGSIVNSGTIVLGSSGRETDLEILFRGVTLSGAGQVVLSDSTGNMIFGGSTDTVLINLDNTISGAGQLGGGQLRLDNRSMILADVSNALVIDTGANVITNSGTLESSGSGGLLIYSDVANTDTGLLWANGGDIVLHGATSGGNAQIDGVATIEFNSAASTNVTLSNTASGTIKIADSDLFTGSVMGLNADDVLDFADIDLFYLQMSYAANADGAGGTLTVSDGVDTANINLIGQYSANGFQSTADLMGGTIITYI